MDSKNKIVYQVYIRSFMDSNGDGIGDIKGIISKLDYFVYLGVDYIWLNPFYPSPQRDNGYDIMDYKNIDPIFGTMDDFEMLCKKAKQKGIGIMLDMVFNHTSTHHPWFKKAMECDPYYKDFYIFKKSVNGPPTNWKSKFGGSAWQAIGNDEYYLHLFDKEQADLNWENENVRQELKSIINFWIEKGVTGFRFDVINLISKDQFINDDEGDGRSNYTDGKNVEKYLKQLCKESFGLHPQILTAGEMSSTSLEKCVRYTNPNNKELNMVFSFYHLKVDYPNMNKWETGDVDFDAFKAILFEWQTTMEKENGWNALFLNNHDQPRSVSRFGDDGIYRKQSAKMLATIIDYMKGTPFIYQGEEIAMANPKYKSIDEYRDVESLNYYQILKQEGKDENSILKILQQKSRDNSRSPMQWDEKGGFTTGKSWIDMNEDTSFINVKEQISNPDSVLNYYRKMIQIRKQNFTLQQGVLTPLNIHKDVFSYKRNGDDEIVVIGNLKEIPISITLLNSHEYTVLLSNYEDIILDLKYQLRPYEVLVLQKNKKEKIYGK